jgi:hypothetical protein
MENSRSSILWSQIREALRIFMPVCTAYDGRSINVYFLNVKDLGSAPPDAQEILQLNELRFFRSRNYNEAMSRMEEI